MKENKEMDINTLRKQIEKIDSIIIEQLSKRKKISVQIGKIKEQAGKEVYDPAREKQLMDYYKKESLKYNIDYEYILSFFNLIINHSRKVQSHSHETNKN